MSDEMESTFETRSKTLIGLAIFSSVAVLSCGQANKEAVTATPEEEVPAAANPLIGTAQETLEAFNADKGKRMPASEHEKFMWMAIEEAHIGEAEGGPAIGSLVVLDGQVIAKAHNTVEPDLDATAHGEVIAIRKAGQVLGRPEMTGATLYSTGEPCILCAGAIVYAGISRVVLGGNYHKSVGRMGDYSLEKAFALVNRSSIEVVRGVLLEECEAMRWAYWAKRARR